MRRSSSLRIPLTAAELGALEQAALERGIPAATWARQVLLAAVGVEPVPDGRVRREPRSG